MAQLWLGWVDRSSVGDLDVCAYIHNGVYIYIYTYVICIYLFMCIYIYIYIYLALFRYTNVYIYIHENVCVIMLSTHIQIYQISADRHMFETSAHFDGSSTLAPLSIGISIYSHRYSILQLGAPSCKFFKQSIYNVVVIKLYGRFLK